MPWNMADEFEAAQHHNTGLKRNEGSREMKRKFELEIWMSL
jgi:hypothetical protein